MQNRSGVSFFCLLLFLVSIQHSSWLTAQEAESARPVKKTPADIEFTRQMSRAQKDLEWSTTYFQSYQMTKEESYLKLAARFCMKAISRLTDTQNQLSRTTKFYQQVDQKRLQACQTYDMLYKKSLLLLPKYHLQDSGRFCR